MTKGLKEREILIEELQGDILTPISIFQRMKGKKKFLLESSLKHENSGRYSFIGASPAFELKGFSEETMLITKDRQKIFSEKPLELLKTLLPEEFQGLHETIPFIGGAVGFVAYDVIRHYEKIGRIPRDEIGVPDVHFMMFEEVVVYDHLKQKVYLIGLPLADHTTMANLKKRLSQTKEQIQNGKESEEHPVHISSYKSAMEKEEFIEKVKKAKE